LAEDHSNAKTLAKRLAEIPGIDIDPTTVETNILIINIVNLSMTALEISEKLLKNGVRIGAMGPDTMRAVTHLDVDKAGINKAADLFEKICR
jgi:threonine aldolase